MAQAHKYMKKGGASFKLSSGKIVKKGQTFIAFPSEVAAFPDLFQDMGYAAEYVKPNAEDVVQQSAIPDGVEVPVSPAGYAKIKSKRPSRFDVINLDDGSAVNVKPLKESEAETLLAELQAKK